MTTPSAGHRVAHIFELLEQILLHVLEDPVLDGYRLHMSDPKTVVASQRISTSFRDTIAGSKKLQQALMFTAPVIPTSYRDPFRCNPVIEDFLILGTCWEPLRAPRSRSQNIVSVDVLALDSLKNSSEQSWRRMYLSSEPYDVVVVQDFDDVEAEFVYMRNVTFGQVYDRALVLEEAKKARYGGADEKRKQWA